MAFIHTPITLEALTQARDLARLIGADDYLKDQAKAISATLLARPTLPSHITRRQGSTWQRQEIKRVVTRPSVMRTLPAKQREIMRKSHPQAWAAAVRITTPEHPFHVRLDAAKAGQRSVEWNTIKAASAQEQRAVLEGRFGDRDWSQPGVQAQTLFELRELRRGTETKVSEAKVALSRFVIDHELPLIIPGYEDGKLVTRETSPGYAVDYDLLELRFPAAAKLVNRSAVSGSERIDFRLFVPTVEEPDDSDDSAWGIWKS